MTRQPRGRTLLAQLLLAVFATLVGLVLVEGAIRGLDLMSGQRAIASGTAAAYETSPDAETGSDRPASRWILHPFRGVTPRPLYEIEEKGGGRYRSNAFGIRSSVGDPRVDLAEDDLVIGIFGGSFARIIGHHGGDALAEAVTEALGDSAPRVRVVNFALSGYKQPQQTFELAELLLLGVPIDVVVNVDGFNEAALSLTDANLGHHPLYPHFGFWNAALNAGTGTLSLEQIERTAEVAALRRRVAEWRDWAATSRLGRLALSRALIGTHIARLQARAVAAEEALRELPGRLPKDDRFRLDDPCLDGSEDGCLDLVIELWRRGSHLMASVARAFDAHYLHALQPNQYVEGSKVLSAEEQSIAWNPQRPWSRSAAVGYPRLREAGRQLREEGIAFHDLTQVFADHTETLYIDACCHINRLGADIVGAEIGRHLGTVLAASPRSPTTETP